MLRSLFIATAILAGSFCCDISAASARIVSYGNPSSHFNIHGVNYGSMRWERQQGNRRALFGRSIRRSRRWR